MNVQQLAQPKYLPEQKIGIIIPAYNPDPEQLDLLISRTATACKFCSFHILVVDDGSEKPVKAAADGNIPLELIRNPENRGKGAALKRGFRHFLVDQPVDYIVTLDADLQHPPEKIPEFMETLAANSADIVVGYRSRSPRTMPPHRILSNTLTSLLISLLTGQLVKDSQCGFRLIDARVLRNLPLEENGFHLESELLIRAAWKGFGLSFVPIPTIYNKEKSSIKNFADTVNFVSLIFQLIWERLFKYV